MKPSRRLTAILLAIFVTLLWSTSWVLIKIGLRGDLPAITFAGLRYTLAFVCLMPFVAFQPRQRAALKALTRGDWVRLSLLGMVCIAVSQGAMFLALSYLPANTVSLLLNLTSVFVGLAGIFLLKEFPTWLQWTGIGLAAAGVGVYFFPVDLPAGQLTGILVGLLCMFANVASTLIGRNVNRTGSLSPLIVTFVSMGVGSLLMLGVGLAFQGFGTFTWTDWAIIAWMAVANTAFAFTLWNRVLQTLTAVEASVLNSLMMPQVALLAWLFLGEKLDGKAIAGLLLVGAGTLIVQLKRRKMDQKSGTG
jgi:drug/metabolite transporter (DMT)-like permease